MRNDPMEIKLIQTESIIPYARNPRKNDSAVDKVVASIKEFGFRQPIVVDEEMVIIVGHTRLEAAKRLGLKKLPVHIAKGLTPEQVKAYRIADNKTNEFSQWDMELLGLELIDLEKLDYNTELTGFDVEEIASLINVEEVEGLTDDDAVPEASEDPVSAPGDIWLLGDHRIMCGDSTKEADVAKLMGNKKADMIFTDPPYNVDYTGKTKDALKIKNDNFASGFYEFLVNSFTNMRNSAKSGAAIYVCHADSAGHEFRKAMVESGWLLKQVIVWVKNTIVLGRQDYHWQHEPILYGWAEGGTHKWYGDRKQSTVWHENKPNKSEVHPTMKPVELITRAINNSSKSDDLILDLFLGSGSTLIASEKSHRICYGMELDSRYCDVIVKRWQDFTGNDAVNLNTKEKFNVR